MKTRTTQRASLFSLIPFFSACVLATELLDEARLQAEELQSQQPLKYGVDVSFPMHHQPDWDLLFVEEEEESTTITTKESLSPLEQFTRDRRKFYREFLKGCIHAHGTDEDCLRSERERIDMSLRQPASMKNMTKGLGFRKLKVPQDLFQTLKTFWNNNQDQLIPEVWKAGSTYVNHWEASPSIIKVENETLVGGGLDLTNFIWSSMRDIVEEWTGHALQESSMYGIRVYKTGNMLATHVDRQPLISSVIINVAQDVDEPWPLEVIGTDGNAYNITMEPGDLVLYESHTLLHGRPYPLQGRFMANLFIHFEPIHPLGQEPPVKKLSDIPIYRLPKDTSQHSSKCIPTKNKRGIVYCKYDTSEETTS